MDHASFLLGQPRGVHGTSPGCAFSIPKLDGSLTLPEIYDWHLENNSLHPVFAYVDQSGKRVELTYSDVVPAAHRAAQYVVKACNISEDLPRPVVAIVATTNTVTYFTALLGLLLAGIPAFPMSPGNSSAAIAHLLRSTCVSRVLISDDQLCRDVVNKALEQLTADGQASVEARVLPTFQQIYTREKPFSPLRARAYEPDAITVIVHSSGSTSFPKPIYWNHKSYLQVALMPHFGQHDLCEKTIACHAVAMFHAIGLNCLAWLPSTGFVMEVFDPELSLPRLIPDSVFGGLSAGPVKPDYVFAVPSFLQVWAQDEQKVAYFRELKGGLLYGGGPLAKSCGDYLTERGVRIYTLYGASEVGVIATIFPEYEGKDWDYFTINRHCAAEFKADGDGNYELIVVAKPTQELQITNCTFNGLDAYATKDILARHPTKPGLWKIVGRADDQIMLSTGEKTNPGPLEAILNEHPQVAASVMFGRGRIQNGVLVQLKEPYLSKVGDAARISEYRNNMWPTVEKMNSFAPSHSKLFKEMIIFATAAKPFTFTAKGAPRRPQILLDYEKEIDDLYRAVEESAQHDIDVPTSWSPETSLQFTRTVVQRVLGPNVRDDQNIFEFGCDSLNATWIRNSILRSLRTTAKRVSRDTELTFVYQYPTISLLSQFILIAMLRSLGSERTIADNVNEMHSLVSRHATDFSVHAASSVALPSKEVVLVTGTTGSLGCAVLVHLVETESVEIIYAFNRRSSHGKSIRERQKWALEERGYSSTVIDNPKVVLLEGEFSKHGIALEGETIEGLRGSITHIMHLAWPVDFNLALSSFEPAIKGVRNLIDLALSSPHQVPPRLIFISSIGVLHNWEYPHPVEETVLTDPAVAAGQGYGESKWVSERVLDLASERTPLSAVVVRVGQLSGAPSGAWNSSDWLPIILKSSIALGALPDLQGTCTWLPVDVAAMALCEFRCADQHTLHLAHPRPAQAAFIMQVLSTEFRLPVIRFAEWMARLETSQEGQVANVIDSRLQDIPALKILPFLQDVRTNLDRYHLEIEQNTRDCMGYPVLCIDKALRWSPTLEGLKTSITDVDVLSWVKFWRRIGFLPQTDL